MWRTWRHDAHEQTSFTSTCLRSVFALILGACLTSAASLYAQVVHGTVSSAVGAGRVPGAVVLLLDSSLTPQARALTSDSGTFSIGTGARGRFHIKVMRIGFHPTESRVFDLGRDTTVDLALTDIPVVLPAVRTRDRNDCRLHPDTSAAGALTFALWDQARTALMAASITLEQQDYRFAKLLHLRVYDVKQHAVRDIALRETETRGTAPWTSLPAERLRDHGYITADDSGTTFFGPDVDVLLSPYFTEEHCFRLTSRPPPAAGFIGLDFEPAGRPRHVEIRGTLWLDSASTELRSLSFSFVNLPFSAPDTVLGGHIEFVRLTQGAWIIPSWSIRTPTAVRSAVARRFIDPFVRGAFTSTNKGHWGFTTDIVRIAGGDVRTVRRGEGDDSVLWRRPTGSVRMLAIAQTDTGPVPASGVMIRLAGSRYGGYAATDGKVRFDQVLPGSYLFEATTPLHDVIGASLPRTPVTVRSDTLIESSVTVKPLAQAVGEVCDDPRVSQHESVLAGWVTFGENDSPMPKVKVTVEWTGGEAEARSTDDGYYRICGVPREQLLLIRASAEQLMVTRPLTLEKGELVRRVDLKLQP